MTVDTHQPKFLVDGRTGFKMNIERLRNACVKFRDVEHLIGQMGRVSCHDLCTLSLLNS